ncbi:DUF4465 domain-containing protein [Bacteroidia bacterium]|nr:DUF4465 domain-containing protein [Bacteroidia bacterium]
MKKNILILLALVVSNVSFAQFAHQRVYSTFDNLPLAKADTFNNGADRSGGFTHYGRFFNNSYDTMWGSWSGWSLSNMKDSVTAGFGNQYSAISGIGLSSTTNYMVSTGDAAYIKFDEPTEISGAYFTNSTYAYRDMVEGSGFSKKFGGDDGNDEDFLRIVIGSYLAGNKVDSVIFYLADYRFPNNNQDYILKNWEYVNFSNSFEDTNVDSISFRYEGSDVGEYGLNTPKYFCMDDLNAIGSNINYLFEPLSINTDTFYNGADLAGGFNSQYLFFPNSYNSQWGSWSGWSISSKLDSETPGFGNQYSCINDSKKNFYLAGGQQTEIRGPYFRWEENLLNKKTPFITSNMEISITNSTYAALDMEQGSGFSKKFGGVDGRDPDYFRLLVSYVDALDAILKTDTIYLADFRFADDSKDYILKDWKQIKMYDDNEIKFHKLRFNLESSDTGDFGMNTPAYFCLNYNFKVVGINELGNSVDHTVSAYPNPMHNILTISSEYTIQKVSVCNVLGASIDLPAKEISATKILFSTADLPSGVYFVTVRTEYGKITKRIVKH